MLNALSGRFYWEEHRGLLRFPRNRDAGASSAPGPLNQGPSVPGPALAILHTWNNRQNAPEAILTTRKLPGNKKGWGFPRKQASLFFWKSPAFSLCACAQAGRQSRPARERHVFVFFVSAVHCLENKSYTIRKRRGPGRNLLPGGVWGSAPAFPLQLRNIA